MLMLLLFVVADDTPLPLLLAFAGDLAVEIVDAAAKDDLDDDDGDCTFDPYCSCI